MLRHSYLLSFKLLMEFMDEEIVFNVAEILPKLSNISDYYSFLELDEDLSVFNDEEQIN